MELTKKEKDTANLLKIKFSEVRSDIEDVQGQMEYLNTKAGSLIKDLENLREQESNFIDSLSEKYGEGNLDPFKLIYIK